MRTPYLMGGAVVAALILAGCSSGDSTNRATTAGDIAATSTSTAATSTAGQQPAPTSQPPATSAPVPTSPPTTTTLAIAELAIPETKDGLIAALSETEGSIRSASVDDATATEWGRRQQRLYQVLASNPDWETDVIAGVTAETRYGVEQNWAARQALTSLVKSETLSETLPAWQLREPLPAAELMGYYREAEAQTGIPWNYLAAINLIETRMGRIEGFSTAGATGPMQFLPSTWEECCEGDPTIDRDAIIGAGNFLVRVGGLEDMQAALFRYNRSDRYVNAVTAYAEVMAENELAYRGYHAWQVYFLSASGLILMPTDYYEPEPVQAADWLAANPDALVAPPDE